ncbi:ADP-ribosylation [Stereum hirsutum FP-91666 SS1]|uniref:ADP-ribosylation n=1 Tax=Stereum hirsutum (strain FP-91666) TaxID=721885 RepID=UPI00044496DB|nr:ADP-ribosylation [Stereum hirsutum FP-91666 SS1]EIM82248.1 ADP-ribosylation [Stereum hirsutum FP-91666 SS1]
MRVVRILEVRQDVDTMRSYEYYWRRFTGEHAKESFQLHGTNRQCMLGEDDDEVTPCDSSLCYLCCILRYSFDVAQSGKKFSFKRFGHGIYLTPVSSKAHDYVDNHLPQDAPEAPKVMILARVVLGRQITPTANMYYLQSPPEGYDSVIGRPGIHPDMNYEETVVYNNDAVRPAYLIVYEIDAPEDEESQWQSGEPDYGDGQVQESDTSDEEEENGEQDPEIHYSDDGEVQESDHGEELEVEVDEEQEPGTNYDDGHLQDSYTSDKAETENEEGQDPETYYPDDGDVQGSDPGEEVEVDEDEDEEQYPEIHYSDDGEVQESDPGEEMDVEAEAEEYEEQDPEVNYDGPVQEPDASDEDKEVTDEEQDFTVDDDADDISDDGGGDDDYDVDDNGSDEWDD